MNGLELEVSKLSNRWVLETGSCLAFRLCYTPQIQGLHVAVTVERKELQQDLHDATRCTNFY